MRCQREHGLWPVAVTALQPVGSGLCAAGGAPGERACRQDGGPSLAAQVEAIHAIERQIDAAIVTLRPSIVHAHSTAFFGLPALMAARRRGLPFVYEVRGGTEDQPLSMAEPEEGWPNRATASISESWVLRRADEVVTVCESSREELEGRLRRTDRVSVVASGVDSVSFAPRRGRDDLRARWRLEGKRVLGFIGTLQRHERLDVLIAAMARIAVHVPNAHLLIVGPGEEETRLRTLSATTGLGGRVTFTGRVPRDDVADFYALADLVIYPRETAVVPSQRILEAMAMARPILLGDVPAHRELVRPGETGTVFRAGDPDALAARCCEALTEPSWQRVLGQRARAWVIRERRWPDLVARYRRIYDAALDRAAQGRRADARGTSSSAVDGRAVQTT